MLTGWSPLADAAIMVYMSMYKPCRVSTADALGAVGWIWQVWREFHFWFLPEKLQPLPNAPCHESGNESYVEFTK